MDARSEEILIKTERTLLRPFQPIDARGFFELNNDPEVLRYTGDQPFESVEAARQFILRYDHYKKYGLGRWTLLSHDHTYLGFCGLRYNPDTELTDIGFRLARRYWGRGLATEAARAVLRYGLEDLHLPVIIGRARTENKASIRVLHKIGMRLFQTMMEDGSEWKMFRSEELRRNGG